MNALSLLCASTLATIAAIAIIGLSGHYFPKFVTRIGLDMKSKKPASIDLSIEADHKKTHTRFERHHEDSDEADVGDLKALKRLYFQLHSLEKFPHILPQARRLLLSLLNETSTSARETSESQSILFVKSFSRQNLEDFQRRRDTQIGKEWEQYNFRRKDGGLRELFSDREEAIWWLKQIAPVKFVDGAWLGHIGKVTTPFALQKTMKGAWQILSEELGDGDLEKNHVHLYHKLIETVAPGFPSADGLDFGHPRHRLDDLSVWKAAVAQLLISLFPNEFLPEILGFNLHFEAISMDTLKAGMELKEVGIDPYYFILHISIDNAHSGHSAIAIEIVCEYMDYVRRHKGEAGLQKAWEKIQAGYLLSSCLPGTIVCPSKRSLAKETILALNPAELEVMKIFKAKANVVHGIHCSSKVRIGSRSITDWLDPAALQSIYWQKGLLNALSCSKYWICRGNSSRSRFIQELQWNGRMFGSFTHDEYNVLRVWIDGLSSISSILDDLDSKQEIYNDEEDAILSGCPSFQKPANNSFSTIIASSASINTLFSFQNRPPVDVGQQLIIETFLTLWLSHPCLLQGFVFVPFGTKNELACTVIKILRAQGGFDIEQECVAGMGEVRRVNSLGLAGLGMHMMAQHGGRLSTLPSLKHVLEVWPVDFAVHMLQISMRPVARKSLLIGMATAFADMHAEIATSSLGLLSAQDRRTLQVIAERELEGLEFCWKSMEADENMHSECCAGYLTAAHEIKKCFQA